MDGLQAVRVTSRPHGEIDLVDDDQRAMVPRTVRISMPATVDGRRDFDVPMTLTLQRAATAGRGPAAWKVADVRVGDAPIRLFDAPIIVGDGDVAVLAEGANESLARLVAAEAAAALEDGSERWGQVAAPERAGIYLVDTAETAAKLLERDQRDPAPDLRPTGWTWDDGDVVFLVPRLADDTPTDQAAAVWHEATHVALTPLAETIPSLIAEGIATTVEVERATRSDDRSVDLSTLRDAFRAQSLGYDSLIASDETDFGRSDPDDVQLGYLAGYATVGYLQDRHSANKFGRLLSAMRAGESFDDALNRIYGLDTDELQAGVRVWTADQVRLAAGAAG
jgi:hypothetical protein